MRVRVRVKVRVRWLLPDGAGAQERQALALTPHQELKSGKQRKTQAGALLLRQKILREATVLDLEILKVRSTTLPASPYISLHLPVSPYG